MKLFRKTALASAVAVMATGLASLPAQAAVGASWADTATRTIDLTGLQSLGALSNGTLLTVNINLALQHRDELDAYVAEVRRPGSPAYGQFLTPAEFSARYSPSPQSVQRVSDYLRAAGFTNLSVSANRTIISAVGSAAVIRSAFNTEIAQFKLGDRTAFANTRPVRVPASLSGIVLSVVGLQTVHQAHLSQANSSATATSYQPTQLAKAYGADSLSPATSESVGVLLWGSPDNAISNLNDYAASNGYGTVNLQTVEPGATSRATADGTLEWSMDTQTILGVTGGVASMTLFVGASNSDSDLETVMNDVVTQQSGYVRNINNSWDGCERTAHSTGFMAAVDQILEQASSQGQVFFFSTGDSGSNGCSSRVAAVGYPSSSPYAVAVGGTSLYTNSDGSYSSESAWSGGGGGISSFEAAPSWQSAALGNSMREVPDIAFDGDPATGVTLSVHGHALQGSGGTSLSSPIAVALWTRLNANMGALGFPGAFFYDVLPSSVFHDVTTGSNGAYSAGPGYDLTTGQGSMDISAVLGFFTN